MLQSKYLVAACVFALAINAGIADAAGRGGGHSSGGHPGGGGQYSGGGGHYGGGRVSGGYVGGRYGGAYRGRYYGDHRRPYYGGYYGDGYFGTPIYYDEPVGDVSPPQPSGPVIPSAFALSCHHSEETVTVPSENGGNQTIRIIRC